MFKAIMKDPREYYGLWDLSVSGSDQESNLKLTVCHIKEGTSTWVEVASKGKHLYIRHALI